MFESIIHGNEEAIERASDEFFPVLADHTSNKTGKLEQSGMVDRRIDAARWRLHAEGLDFGDIQHGRVYAEQVMKDCIAFQRDNAIREQAGDSEI